MVTTYTSGSAYWQPLKPRIRIYAFTDTTYSSPLYSYDPFTDVATDTRPISLQFDTTTTNAGTFSLEIEDSGSLLDLETLTKGCRVFIDCSKDGVTYQAAFKGLVRSVDQQIYGVSGRNIILHGYSYLIRLNERLINVIKQSAIVSGAFDRTDSTMFTNNLINDLLTTDSNYVYSTDDTALYSVLKTSNITASTITEWVPKLDAQESTVINAIDSVLEFSNSLITVDFSTDQLMVYNTERADPATGVFLMTNQLNQNADDADITMYPVDQYKYNVSYDYPDSASRLILSLKSPNTADATTGAGQCPQVDEHTPDSMFDGFSTEQWMSQGGTDISVAVEIIATGSPISKIRMALTSVGNISSLSSSTVKILNSDGSHAPSTQVGSNLTVYRNSVVGTAYPSAATNVFILGMEEFTTGPAVTQGNYYYIALIANSGMTDTNRYGWISTGSNGHWYTSTNSGSTWSASGGLFTNSVPYRLDYAQGGQQACGGVPDVPAIAKDVFLTAHDRNMSGRIGVVEKALTSIPLHIIDLQTANEYVFNKLYVAGKPRFNFEFPSVTMPNKLPKAGDIVTHVDRKANVGIRSAPIQTGVISSISYDFAQNDDGVLGLRKLGLTTTGIRRGYY